MRMAATELFMDPGQAAADDPRLAGQRGVGRGREALAPALRKLAGKRVRVDPSGSPVWFAQPLREAGATVVSGRDPCLLPKACKNATEQQGARDAHARDAVAVCRFLHWLSAAGARRPARRRCPPPTKLLALRRQVDGFRGESFPAISGAGEHGAIIHYRVTDAANRPIRPNEVYLIDSGAQYPDGTTDITRTVWTGPGDASAELRDRVTRVHAGAHRHRHRGVSARASAARIWTPSRGARCGRRGWTTTTAPATASGSYLSVHEGPVSLSRLARPVPIAAGMILSNEPGFYLPDHYGIRLENLLLVQPADLPGAGKPFLRFETLTLAPFDRRLLDPASMTTQERAWLDAYHARVLHTVAPALGEAERTWLAAACAPLTER